MSALADGAIKQADTDAQRVGKLLGAVHNDDVAMRSAMTQLLQETIILRGEMRAVRILLQEADERRFADIDN